MKDALLTFWEALKDFWDELFLLTLMSAITVLLALPVVTLPPAMAGLWNAANRVANGKAISWRDYWEGFRRYFWKAWGLALLNVLALTILLTNIWFYGQENIPFALNETVKVWIQACFAVAGVLWLLYQMYPLAMLLEQENQQLRLALRNAAAILLINPIFTITFGLLLLIVAGVSTFLPMLWLCTTPALFAVACNKAVLRSLEPYRERMKEKEKERSGE